MTIHVPQDLAVFIEDAVRTGQYDREDDVIRDALIRLRQALEVTAATTDQGGEPVLPKKPLTKQTLQRHLAEIGLVDQSPDASSDPDGADAPLFDNEHEIISEMVIRERLIEWLAGFL
jgi:Arc/MetJ-type ribon-helix-helix transcriptional regulator